MRDYPVKGGFGTLVRTPGARRRNFIIFMSVGLVVVIPLLVLASIGVFNKEPAPNVAGGTDGDVSSHWSFHCEKLLSCWSLVTCLFINTTTDSLISSLRYMTGWCHGRSH